MKTLYPINKAINSYRDCSEENFLPLLKYFTLVGILFFIENLIYMLTDQ